MIGQKNVRALIDKWIERNNFPRFLILGGPKGSGKKLIARYISNKLNTLFIVGGIKVDEVRDLIDLSYSQIDPITYFFDNSDNMSIQSKNAILKVTEEPPQSANFIISTEDTQNILTTLKSRGTVITLDVYSPQDLLEYVNNKQYTLNDQELRIVTNVCETPGEIDSLISYKILDFYSFVDKVISNLGLVSGVNAFKIASKMKFKESDEGWEIPIFIKMIQYRSLELAKERPELAYKFYAMNNVCAGFKRNLNKTSYNKSMNFDCWLLEARSALC